MKGVFARMEIEQKSVRQKRSAKQRAEAGKPWWSVVAFGYRTDGDQLVLDEPCAALVRTPTPPSWRARRCTRSPPSGTPTGSPPAGVSVAWRADPPTAD